MEDRQHERRKVACTIELTKGLYELGARRNEWQRQASATSPFITCVYRKLKPGRSDGEARRELDVNESFRPDESDGKSAHPCAETNVF